jgi:mono/diheme cytochrome c family protein
VSANTRTFLRPLAALTLVLAVGGCQSWITDMVQQPSVGTWQKFSTDSLTGETTPFRGNPQGSVPVTGVTPAEWEVSYTPSFVTVDSMSRLANPVAADSRSLANGQRLYAVNCMVCHGALGDANSPMRAVSMSYGFAPPINGAATQARSDGYLWGMMRNGRGLMASFNRIPEAERWDVVNYIRGLQGRYPVPTGHVTYPGGAAAFSGHSATAPTAPSAYVRPSTAGATPAAPKPASASTSGGH